MELCATAAKVGKRGTDMADAANDASKAKTAAEAGLKAGDEAAEQAGKHADEAAGAGKGKDGAKIKGKGKKGPCDHLRGGNPNGKGPYRGGAHSHTSRRVNDGKDSHHMPADEVSSLAKRDGPAIQMEPSDHRRTSSNGNQGLRGVQYRKKIGSLLEQGRWRDAMAEEIRDIRKLSREMGEPTKYNEATREMLRYFKCLEKHGLV